MDKKLDNKIRIKELEEDLSDERIAKHFRLSENAGAYISERLGRPTGRAVFRRVLPAAVAMICLITTFQFFSPKIILDDSMETTIHPGDCLLVAGKAYAGEGVRIGDVVAHGSRITDNNRGARELYNRVIGLPGDVIEIKGGGVYRNGERLDEPYIKDGVTSGALAPSTVPEGCYFVLGDNRQMSVDSRDGRVGYVPAGQIRGKVVWRILPVSRSGGLQPAPLHSNYGN